MKILFTGGGTGGHIFPIIAVYRECQRLSTSKHKFYYLGPKDETSETFLSKEDITIKYVMAGKIRRYFDVKSTLLNLVDIIFKIPIGTIQALFYIFFVAPDVIFSKGGYGSVPVVFAGWILGTPVFLHESDAIPGAANHFLSRFSLEIFSAFPRTESSSNLPEEKTIAVGNPIRPEVIEGSTKEIEDSFNLSGGRPVILIVGGSQGSQRINDVILQALSGMLQKFEVIHQCGTKNFSTVKSESDVVTNKDLKKYYHLFPFLSEQELAAAYKLSSLIVSRSGSGSIFEIAAMGKPSIIIPLPESAQNHQVENAYHYAHNGACVVIEESNFAPHFFLERLDYLFAHKDQLANMAKAATNFSRPRAAEVMAAYLLEYLKL